MPVTSISRARQPSSSLIASLGHVFGQPADPLGRRHTDRQQRCSYSPGGSATGYAVPGPPSRWRKARPRRHHSANHRVHILHIRQWRRRRRRRRGTQRPSSTFHNSKARQRILLLAAGRQAGSRDGSWKSRLKLAVVGSLVC